MRNQICNKCAFLQQIWEKLEELDNIMQEMQVFEAEDT